MLRAHATALFSDRYAIVDEAGREIATVRIRWWREAGSFEIDGTRYDVGRRHLMRGPFELQQDGRELASARKPSAFHRRFEIDAGGERYHLVARHPLRRTFDLRRDGAVIGSIRPTSLWTRSAVVDLPESLSLPLRVFMTWLVLAMWRRQRGADS